MTTGELALRALPYARRAVRAARPEVIEAVGRLGWLTLWPAWSLITGPLLPILVRLAVELAVGLAAPWVVPILTVLEPLAAPRPNPILSDTSRQVLRDLAELFATPRDALSSPVREALAGPPRPEAIQPNATLKA